MRTVYDSILMPLCNEDHTYEQLLAAVSEAAQEAGPGGYVYVHGSAHCTDELCACDGPVQIEPIPEPS